MFTLFFNLYYAMFRGVWQNYTINDLKNLLTNAFNGLGTFLTSIFNDSATMDTLGNVLFESNITGAQPYMLVTSFVLASITSIGIVVMAVKGVKKAFGIFFMGLR